MDRILLFGAGGHGRVILDIALLSGFEVVGFLDVNKPVGSSVDGVPVLGSQADLSSIAVQSGVRKGVVCLGDNWTRGQVVGQILRDVPNFEFVSLVHPRAIVANSASVGAGSVIMAGALLNPGVKVGDHAIINTGCCVDHDCELASFASLAPGVVIGGGVSIGEFSAVGLGAHIIHGKRVGRHSVVGASSLVTHDIEDSCVAYGIPAKMIRNRTEGEKYL